MVFFLFTGVDLVLVVLVGMLTVDLIFAVFVIFLGEDWTLSLVFLGFLDVSVLACFGGGGPPTGFPPTATLVAIPSVATLVALPLVAADATLVAYLFLVLLATLSDADTVSAALRFSCLRTACNSANCSC